MFIGWNEPLPPSRCPPVMCPISPPRAVVGGEPHPESSAEFAKFIEAETTKWGKVVKASGARID